MLFITLNNCTICPSTRANTLTVLSLFLEAALYMCLCSDMVDQVRICRASLKSFNVLDVVYSLGGPYRRGICEMCTNDSKIDCSLRVYTFDAV